MIVWLSAMSIVCALNLILLNYTVKALVYKIDEIENSLSDKLSENRSK